MGNIFLIKKIWTASMENQIGNAVGYKVSGFVTTEKEAKEICEESKVFTQKDCWAIIGEMVEYKYEEIKKVVR